jgi:hypothetical protein
MNKAKLIFVIIFLVAIISTALYLFRYNLFSHWSPSISGKLTLNKDTELSENIDFYFEKHYSAKENRPYMCGHHFLGKDDRYAYIDLVCGFFRKSTNGEVLTDYGLQISTRVEYSKSLQVTSFDQPLDGTHNFVSYKWIFPKEVQSIHKGQKNELPWNNIHLKALERHQKNH